jgi:hypothetical protein
MLEMTFYVTREDDGTVHVQNTIGGLFGQHHVHTPEGFEEWRKPSDHIEEMQNTKPCTCGLAPGEMR